jgi:hypothetical protein
MIFEAINCESAGAEDEWIGISLGYGAELFGARQ